MHFKMPFAICLNLDRSKILTSGNGLSGLVQLSHFKATAHIIHVFSGFHQTRLRIQRNPVWLEPSTHRLRVKHLPTNPHGTPKCSLKCLFTHMHSADLILP